MRGVAWFALLVSACCVSGCQGPMSPNGRPPGQEESPKPPFPRAYGVAWRNGRPTLTADGKAVVLPSYCSCGPLWKDQWLAAHRNFARHGRKVFWLMPTGGYNKEWGTTPFWTGPGAIHDVPVAMPADYFGIDAQARALVEMEPQARFFVRMMDMPPATWGKAHPDDMQLNSDGKRYESASFASDLYVRELSDFLKALTRYCERQPWADRIIGYVIYPLAEGTSPLACEGYLFDRSPVMRDKFRAFLREKYGSDAALRRAWADADVTLEAVEVPRDGGLRRRSEKPVLFWPEAAQVQPERDYFECQRPLFRRYLDAILTAFHAEAKPGRLCGLDAFKGNMLGWMTHAIFSGAAWKEHYGDQFLAAGTTPMSELLDDPRFSIVATPHDYRARWIGFGYDPEGIGDSICLRGKVMFIEEDQRSYANDERGLFGSIRPGEEEAVFYRNLAAALTRGQQTYPMDVCVGYFEAEPIQRVLARRARIQEEFLAVPRADVPSVVMLVDDGAAYCTDFSAEYNDLAVIRQRIGGMNHCGVPARTFLWDDLRRADFPAMHRLFLVPNCYKAGDDVLALLREKLFRNGNVIVFGPGTGITDGRATSPESAAQLLGMEFELYDYDYPRFVTIDHWEHPLTAGVGAAEGFGDTLRYGPVLVPWDPRGPECTGGQKPRRSEGTRADGGFVRLGTIALDSGKRRPGLVVKEFGRGAAGNGRAGRRGPGDYAIVFTTAVPLPAALLRNLARFSATHVYDEQDDVVYADTASVAVHAVMPGRREIRLPGRFRVRDVITGQPVSGATDRVAFEVNGPVTRWFRLEPAP